MSWNNPNGGGGGGSGRGPWSGGGGPGGSGPPDLEELLKRGQEKLRDVLPGNFGKSGMIMAGLVVAVVWLLSGVYFVQPDEQGVVLRFGAYVRNTGPGINYHLPWPVESVVTPQVTRENQINIGYTLPPEGAGGAAQFVGDVLEESLMLTGDENIVDIQFTVFWIISDAGDFLFNVENPGEVANPGEARVPTIKAVVESVMREVVGRNDIEPILTENREVIQIEVRELSQMVLDSYGAGVTITRVQMQKADPPGQVIDSYRDVQAALTDQERMRNEALAYANRVVPEARGEAAVVVAAAEGYQQQTVNEAEGEAQRFLSVYGEYVNAPEVTRRRIYLETMQGVFANMNKVILDRSDGAGGVIPYLPLSALTPNQTQQAQQQPAAAFQGAAAANTGAP